MNDLLEVALDALKEISKMSDESTGEFRKRGGTYRGLVGIVADKAIKDVAALETANLETKPRHKLTKEELSDPEYMAAYVESMWDTAQQMADEIQRLLEAAKLEAQPVPPHECQTDGEKKAYAFGWWKALETVQPVVPAVEPVQEKKP